MRTARWSKWEREVASDHATSWRERSGWASMWSPSRCGLSAEGGLGLGGEEQGNRRDGGRRRNFGGLRGSGLVERRGLLEDDMALVPERPKAETPARRGAVGARGPGRQAVDDADGQRVPVDVGVARRGVQRGGQGLVAERGDDLGDAGEPGGGLEVTDVGLEGAEAGGVFRPGRPWP